MAEWFECCCGTAHKLRPETAALVESLGPRLELTVAGLGTWLVPRVFIAAHEIKGGQVPALAEKHGWKRIDEAATGGGTGGPSAC